MRALSLLAAATAVAVGATAATLVGGAPARATTLVPLDDAELFSRSELVAVVDVEAARAEWVGRRIVTFVDVRIVEAWREPAAAARRTRSGDVVTVAVLGGEVGGIGQRVFGAPALDVGKRYVVCLGAASGPRAARGVVGMYQGAFALDVDGAVRRLDEQGATPIALPLATLRARMTAASVSP